MKKKSSVFSDAQKAQIYKRDRATCAFSGRSLWNLDFGACPFSTEWDWADHVKPRARKGGGDVSNGLCVSSLFNAKKRANGADTFSLLADLCGDGKAAVPSEDHYRYFGTLSKEWREQLWRLRNIEERDWYFNRAVCHLIWACYLSFHRTSGKRKPEYYRNSALKKLAEFRDREGSRKDLEERGLVLNPACRDVDLLLSMIAEQPLSEFDQKLRQLKRIYAENARTMDHFWQAYTSRNLSRMQQQTKTARKNKLISPAVTAAMESYMLFSEMHLLGSRGPN
jgi:hypothetical protein